MLLAAIALLAASDVRQTAYGKLAILMPEGKPHGSIIVIPGASTEQTISSTGSGSAGRNFVMRIRPNLVAAGFAVAYVESPFDLREPIAILRGIARPVVLVATSNGTIVAVDNARQLASAGPDALVLTSTVTVPHAEFAHAVTPAAIRSLQLPILFLHDTNDICRVSPLGGAQAAASGDKNADFVEVTSDPAPGADQCGPLSPHGFLGIEADVSARIASWIDAHSAARADGVDTTR